MGFVLLHFDSWVNGDSVRRSLMLDRMSIEERHGIFQNVIELKTLELLIFKINENNFDNTLEWTLVILENFEILLMKKIFQNFRDVGLELLKIDWPVGVSSVSNNVMKMSESSELIFSHVVLVSELRRDIEAFVHNDIHSEERWKNFEMLGEISRFMVLRLKVFDLLFVFFLLSTPSLFEALLSTFYLPFNKGRFRTVFLSLLVPFFESFLSRWCSFMLNVNSWLLLLDFLAWFSCLHHIFEILLDEIQDFFASLQLSLQRFIWLILLTCLQSCLIFLVVFSVSLIDVLLEGILGHIFD